MIHDRDAVAQHLGLLEVVCRQEDRPAGRAEAEDDVPERPPSGGIHARGRLVQEDQLRVVDEGERHGQALALPAGQVLGPGRPLLAEVHQADELVGRAAAEAVEAPEQVQDLDHGQLRVERRGLERDADAWLQPVGIPDRIDPEDADLAAVGLSKALEDLDSRGLAGAVGPEQAEDRPGLDLEADPVDGTRLAVCLVQPGHADDGFHGRRGRDAHLADGAMSAASIRAACGGRPPRWRRSRAPRTGAWRPDGDGRR